MKTINMLPYLEEDIKKGFKVEGVVAVIGEPTIGNYNITSTLLQIMQDIEEDYNSSSIYLKS